MDQKYIQASNQYGANISNLKAKVQSGISQRKAKAEEELVSKAREKMQEGLLKTFVKDSELREKHEALASFSAQASLAPEALKKLKNVLQQNFKTPQGEISKSLEEAGKDMEEDAKDIELKDLREPDVPEASSAGRSALSSGQVADEVGDLAKAGTATGLEESAEIAGAEAGELSELGTGVALSEVLGPASVVAGLGFAGYELGESMGWFGKKHHTEKPPPPPSVQAYKQQATTPVHRSLGVAPTMNSALIQAGHSGLA